MNMAEMASQLWPQGDGLGQPQVHMLIDGAIDPGIAQQIRFGRLQFECLFGEPLSPRLRAAAPYLVHLSEGSPQTCDILQRSRRQPSGIFITAPPAVSTRQLRLHFKKLLWVQDESKRPLYFRFYDPRVLAAYLPTCTDEEKQQFFGPAEHLHCLSDGRLLRFSRRQPADT